MHLRKRTVQKRSGLCPSGEFATLFLHGQIERNFWGVGQNNGFSVEVENFCRPEPKKVTTSFPRKNSTGFVGAISHPPAWGSQTCTVLSLRLPPPPFPRNPGPKNKIAPPGRSGPKRVFLLQICPPPPPPRPPVPKTNLPPPPDVAHHGYFCPKPAPPPFPQ